MAALVHPVGYLLLRLEGPVLLVDLPVGAVELDLLLLQLGLPPPGLEYLGAVILHTGAGLRLHLVKAPFGVLDLEIYVLDTFIQHGAVVVRLLGCRLRFGEPGLCVQKIGGALLHIRLDLLQLLLQFPLLASGARYQLGDLVLLGRLGILVHLCLVELRLQVLPVLLQGYDAVLVVRDALLEVLLEDLVLLDVGLRELDLVLLGGVIDLHVLDLLLELGVLGSDLRCDLRLDIRDVLLLAVPLLLQFELLRREVLDICVQLGDLIGRCIVGCLRHLELPVGVLGFGHVQCVLELHVLLGRLAVLLQLLDVVHQSFDDDVDPLQIGPCLRLLLLGLAYIRIETGDTGYAVEDAPPLGVAHLDDVRDISLLHEVVSFRTDPCLGEEVIELRESGFLVVDVEI